MADTAVTFAFADGEYRFWLPLPQVVELERKTGSSILAIEERLRAAIGAEGAQDDPTFVFLGGGAATVSDVRETLRLALWGGGGGLVDGQEVEVGPNMARQLVDTYVYPARPFSEGVVQAWRVLHAAIHGVQLVKKKDAAPEGLNRSEKDS
ncbi:hypothetical protein [Synechococcus phage Ssp-JY40]